MNEPSGARLLTDLRNILIHHFSEEELKTLCSDLGVDYDDLPGQGKEGKARELIGHLERRGCINNLIEIGRRSRTKIDWPGTISGERTPAKPPVSAPDSQPSQVTVAEHSLFGSLPPRAGYMLAATGLLVVVVVLVVVAIEITKSKENLQTGTPNTLIVQGDNTDILELPEGKLIDIHIGAEKLSMIVKPVERLPGFDQFRRDADIAFAVEKSNESYNLRSGDCVYLHPFTINIIEIEPFAPHSVKFFVTKVAEGFDAGSCRIAPPATPVASQ